MPRDQGCDVAGMGCDHEMRGAVDGGERRAGDALLQNRAGALHGRRTVAAAHHQQRNLESRQHRRRQRKSIGARPIADVDLRRLDRVAANPRRPRRPGAGAAVKVHHGCDRFPVAALEVGKISLRHPAKFAVEPILIAQHLYRRRLRHHEAGQGNPVAQRHRERHQAAEGMADQMNRAAGPGDHGLHRLGKARDRRILRATAFGGPAITGQACGDASKPVLPCGDHGPPGSTCAARARHQHDGRTASALVILDAADVLLDHDGTPGHADLRQGSSIDTRSL